MSESQSKKLAIDKLVLCFLAINGVLGTAKASVENTQWALHTFKTMPSEKVYLVLNNVGLCALLFSICMVVLVVFAGLLFQVWDGSDPNKRPRALKVLGAISLIIATLYMFFLDTDRDTRMMTQFNSMTILGAVLLVWLAYALISTWKKAQQEKAASGGSSVG